MNISQRVSLNISPTVYPFSKTVGIYYLSSLLLLVLRACICLLSSLVSACKCLPGLADLDGCSRCFLIYFPGGDTILAG